MSVRLPRSRLFSDTTYIFIAWMVGSSVVLFFVATFFMRNQVRPIRRLAKAAESFGRGIDVPGFKPQGAAEVRLAARAFLQMRERIRRQIDQRTIMLAGVSHDLRTPLTRMKLQLAMASEDPEVASLASDVIEMERMVEGYLAFAAGEGEEEPKTLLLSKFLNSVVEQVTNNGAKINNVTRATFLLHGQLDTLIPLWQAEKLHAECGARSKELQVVPGADHNTLIAVGGKYYFQAIQQFVERVTGTTDWRKLRRKQKERK